MPGHELTKHSLRFTSSRKTKQTKLVNLATNLQKFTVPFTHSLKYTAAHPVSLKIYAIWF
mgnify:CR=1 FL=1